jgi:short-subunit dehydrogenase
MDFAGKTVIITGASAGIGQELAVSLAKQGARLVLAARSVAALQDTAKRCEAAGGKAIAVATDVADPAACEHLINEALAAFGSIDCLVNNAGISMVVPFEQITDLTMFERLMRVNYLGAVYCTRYALPHLKASKGLLVAVSSLTGKTGVPNRTGYSASKHAMQGFFDSLRLELIGSGVDVLVVSPGFVATDIRASALGGDGKPVGESPRDESEGTMSVDECVGIILRAMVRRDREVVMTARARFGLWLKLIAPSLVDRITLRTARLKPGS